MGIDGIGKPPPVGPAGGVSAPTGSSGDFRLSGAAGAVPSGDLARLERGEIGLDAYLDALTSSLSLEEVTPSGLLWLNLTLGAMVLWTWLLIRALHSLRPRWLASVRPRLRWRFLLACLGLSLVALLAQVVVGMIVPSAGDPSLGSEVNDFTRTTLALVVVVLLTTPLQAAGEEYVFRGYLMQAVGSLSRRRWVALLVTATLFAVAHGFQNFPLFFDRFMFGLIAGWLVIRTGGETVAPSEVEQTLAQHPALADVAVVGIPDDRWGEVVCAVAVVAPGATAPVVDELRDWCEGRLATFKRPRRLVVVEAIPRTAATRQVQRRALVERITSGELT